MNALMHSDYYFFFTDEETEVQRGDVSLPHYTEPKTSESSSLFY